MKILMIGLGSIGQRHVRNIRRIYGDDIEIIAYRVRRLQQTFSDAMQIRDGVNLEEEHHITSYSDLDEALAQKPDIAFITNITSKHMECALKCAEAGCDIFLEKPVSNTLEGADKLLEITNAKGSIVFMGYQNRYHVCVKKLREYLAKGLIGRIISVEGAFCERLVTMHTYEDYSITYMARSDMGGGCILNLQIHDIDILQWIFGKPVGDIQITKGTHSELKIDVEDHAVITYEADFKGVEASDGETGTPAGKVTVTSRSDFLCYPPVHTYRIVGEKGRIELDFNKATIDLIDGDGLTAHLEYPDFQRNDMFIEELKLFMDAVKTRKKPEVSLETGIDGLKIALGINS